MDLPNDLRIALESELASVPQKNVADAAGKLSRRYRGGQLPMKTAHSCVRAATWLPTQLIDFQRPSQQFTPRSTRYRRGVQDGDLAHSLMQALVREALCGQRARYGLR